MSYPIHSKIRSGAGRTTRNINGFWGYDPSRNARDRSPDRAADTKNLIWKGEAIGRRSGYSQVAHLPGTVYGLFFYGSELLVHAGDTLYRITSENADPEILYQGLNLAPSQAVVHHQQITRRWLESPNYYGWHRETLAGDMLFLTDQQNLIFYNGSYARSVVDCHWGENVKNLMAKGLEPEYFATVPFTTVAKSPMGAPGDTDPRGDNQLSQFHCESFYVGEEETIDFRLNCTPAEVWHRIPVEMMIRDEEGDWHTFACSGLDEVEILSDQVLYHPSISIAAGTSFTINGEGRITAWGDGKKKMPADNVDNLRIIYAVRKEYPQSLVGAKSMGRFGADGADDVLFLGGSDVAPGVDWFSASGDFTCFYATSNEILGNNAFPITGYCRLSDGRLAVLKNDPDGVNVYFRNHAVISMGATTSGQAYQVDVFPSCSGAEVPGCISPLTIGNVGNEPIFLSDTGLYSVKSVSDTLVNLNQTIHRSETIDDLLGSAKGSLISVSWKGYYMICNGRDAWITDGKRENNALRFLIWHFAHEITAFGKKNGILWMGDVDGSIYKFDHSDTDAGTPFEAFWKTALPEDMGGCRMLLKKAWASFSPDYQGEAKATMIHGSYPDIPLELPLQRLEFIDWDFENVSFDGTDLPRWVSILRRSSCSKDFSVELTLNKGQQLKIWGIRMQYEKGGIMG